MDTRDFSTDLLSYINQHRHSLTTDKGDWAVKGLIDIYHKIYPLSIDTKVISKVIELMLFPVVSRFATERDYRLVLSDHQNHYPDISLITPAGIKIALDIKSKYRTGDQSVNGLTLGAFTGYFRQRESTKNVVFPYKEYANHFVLGVIYSRSEEIVGERRVYELSELQNITSAVREFTIFLQEKWRIASDRPGSGNTKNIGSARDIDALINGNGPFAPHGVKVFDDYWKNYLTEDMARARGSEVPYRNLEEYWKWRKRNDSERTSDDIAMT